MTTYYLRVRANNIYGHGQFSTEQSTITLEPTRPDQPTSLRELVQEKTHNTIELEVGEPERDGGAPIVNYVLESKPSGSQNWTAIMHS